MMKVVDIAFCVYPIKSIKKSREFYEGVLGLKASKLWVQNDASGFIEYDIGTATLAIGAGSDNFKLGEGGATAALEVDDFEAFTKNLKDKKCFFLTEPAKTPVCQMAVILDPDNNKIIIHKRN
jgi:predicted enzyme related to lactoylglutathione lyase